MKKILYYTLSAFLLFFIGNINAFALEMKADDIGNRTYVIGTHMFTRDRNESTGYDGKLTTERLMLASKTIEGNSLSDMVVYYKNPFGVWTNGITGEEVDAPNSFEIEFKDTVELLDAPTITAGFAGAVQGANYFEVALESDDYVNGDSVEVYRSTGESEEFELIETVVVSEMESNFIYVKVYAGYHYHYKVRLCKTSGNNIVYSDFSNVVEEDNSFGIPTLSILELGNYDEYGNLTTTLSVTFAAEEGTRGDTVALYYSTSEDGEYTFLRNIEADDDGFIVFNENIPLAATHYYKVKYVGTDGESTVYSEFSNVVSRPNNLITPEISLSFAGTDSNDNIGQFINVEDFGIAEGIEIYSAASGNGEYSLIKILTVEEFTTDQFASTFIIPAGYHYYFKVRLYKTVGENTVYSDYSNVVDYNNSFVTPQLSLMEYGSISPDGSMNTFLSLPRVQGKLEIYYATSEDGEFNLLRTVESGEDEYGQYSINIPLGAHYYYKVRFVATDNDDIYSEFSNIVSKANNLITPIISLSFAGANSNGEIGQFINVEDFGIADGIEIYSKLSTTGEYSLLKTYTVEEFTTDQFTSSFIISPGYHTYFKVRLYKTVNGEKVYSDYSNVVDYDNAFGVPELTLLEYGTVEQDGTKTVNLSLNEVQGKVEIYYSTSEDGEYTLLRTAGSGDEEYAVYSVSIPLGAHYYYKVRYVAEGDSSIYSEFSNVVSKANKLVTPEISLSFAGANSNGSIGHFINVDNFGLADGVAIYYSTKEDDEYILLELRTVEEFEEFSTVVTMAGYHNYYKVCLYKYVGEDVLFGEYSNVVDYDNSFSRPELYVLEQGSIAGNADKTTYLKVLDVVGNLEIYSSTSEDGEYSLLRMVEAGDFDYYDGQYSIVVPFGEQYYYKVRFVSTDGNIVSDFSNVVSVANDLTTPEISLSFAGANSNGEVGQFINIEDFGIADGIEIYSAEANGQYSLLKTLTVEEFTTDQFASTFIIPAGYHYYFKVRLYKTVGENTVYSDYSNVVDYNNRFATPELTLLEYGSVGQDGSKSVNLSLNEVQGNVEIYYATSEAGEYTLLRTAGSGDEEYAVYSVSIPLGAHYYFKVRYVVEDNSNIYGEFSNVVDYNNTGN